MMLSRRDFLIALSSSVLAAYTAAPSGSAARWDQQRKHLREAAERAGLLYGAATMKAPLCTDYAFAAVFAEECQILVPQNELKWRWLRPTQDVFDFKAADWLERFASERKLLFRGHTLVWHEALPDWFPDLVNRSNAENHLVDHISRVVGRYAGKVHSWDVVNEPLQPEDGQPGGMCNSPWLRLLGSKYIDIAFRAAALADPQALLVLNQNMLEYESAEHRACRRATLKLLERLVLDKVPVHALGIQAHLAGDNNTFRPNSFRSFLSEVADLGLKILVTEMDVADNRLTPNVAARDSVVARRYQEFLSGVLDEPAVIAVITWGVSDKYSWLAEHPRGDGAAVRPLPLSATFTRKPAWYAIADSFSKMKPRR